MIYSLFLMFTMTISSFMYSYDKEITNLLNQTPVFKGIIQHNRTILFLEKLEKAVAKNIEPTEEELAEILDFSGDDISSENYEFEKNQLKEFITGLSQNKPARDCIFLYLKYQHAYSDQDIISIRTDLKKCQEVKENILTQLEK